MFPEPASASSSMDLATGHAARSGRLVRKLQGNDAYLSNVMRAPADQLTDRIVSKMNVLWGVDFAFGGGHQTGGALGNYAATDGEKRGTGDATIDQWIATSKEFYPTLDGVKLRSMIGPNGGDSSAVNGHSWTWSSPTTRSGAIQRTGYSGSPSELFNMLFAGQTPKPDPVVQRKPIVDRVIEDYRRLRSSNRRMNPEDRQRLNDHMDRMSEVQRLVNQNQVTTTAMCKDVKAPIMTMPTFRAFNDVYAAAFMCGASRVAVIGVHQGEYITYPGSWHQQTAHVWDQAEPQARLVESGRACFREVFLDLARKMDVEVAPGKTLLDNGLIQMINECGEETHSSNSIPIFTAGSAGGFLKTGMLCDYRNTSPAAKSKFRGEFGAISGYPGISSNRWLGAILQSMGVPKTDYELNGNRGYGNAFIGQEYAAAYLPTVTSQHGEVLPFLKA
jgi:Protein of unknown function (DUF1552)